MIVHKYRSLVEAVQRNCHISDARHARDKSLCTYLLEMREFFRWEQQIPAAAPIPKDALGDWIAHREALWDGLEDAAFEPLPIAGSSRDPFDIDTINRELLPEGLVYGAGVGRFHKPLFFLGALLRQEQRPGLTILVSEREYARDITAIPAAMQNGIIYLRQEPLRSWLREKIELWELRQTDGPLKSAMECFDLRTGGETALDRMLAVESEMVIRHEIGEVAADRILGASWRDMMGGLSSRRAELFARAVRDNLADCLSTLPKLLENGAACSLHFYFANLEGMRRALFPSLTRAYQLWVELGDLSHLQAAVEGGRSHWAAVGVQLVNGFRPRREHSGVPGETISDGGASAVADAMARMEAAAVY